MKPRRSTVTELFPTRKDPDGCPVCAVCGVRITRKDGKPARRGRRYCGEACRIDAWIRAGNTQTIREEVWRRDRGVCAACGLDTAEIDRLRERAWALRWREPETREVVMAITRRLEALYGSPPWEADHVTPVAEGGGGCGLDGYRTLCVACHKAETAALRRRLAQARRREKIALAVARYGRPPEQLGLW